MAWFLLVVAGLLETAWSTGLKASAEKPGLMLLAVTGVALVASMVTLTLAMRSLPLGVAYPIWTGIGSVGSVVVGVLIFKEQLALTTVVGVVFLCVGMFLIGLKTH